MGTEVDQGVGHAVMYNQSASNWEVKEMKIKIAKLEDNLKYQTQLMNLLLEQLEMTRLADMVEDTL